MESANQTQPIVHRLTLKQKIYRSRASYAMLAPYFILFFFFTILPVLASIVLSFTYFDMLNWPSWVGFNNYARLFLDDEIFLIALKNTLLFAVITGPISYLMCLLFAWIINEFRGKLRAFLTLIFYAPSICGNAYYVWSLILSSDRYGYLNSILLKWGFVNNAVLWFQTENLVMPCLIVVQLWLSLGTGFLSFIAGLQTVDKSMYEAAAIDGAGRLKRIWYITLPSIKTTAVLILIMNIGNLVKNNFEQVYGFQNVYIQNDTDVIGTLSYREGIQGGEYSLATAFGLTQGLVSFALVMAANWISKRVMEVGIW